MRMVISFTTWIRVHAAIDLNYWAEATRCVGFLCAVTTGGTGGSRFQPVASLLVEKFANSRKTFMYLYATWNCVYGNVCWNFYSFSHFFLQSDHFINREVVLFY